MAPKQIRSDTLPQALQAELATMMQAMETKYGPAATALGMHIENLANLCALVRRNDMSDDDRAVAWENGRAICGAVIRDLGQALDVNPAHAFAVAQALGEYTLNAESELYGEREVPAPVVDAALAVLKKAAAA